jgi:hypothetical protein
MEAYYADIHDCMGQAHDLGDRRISEKEARQQTQKMR